MHQSNLCRGNQRCQLAPNFLICPRLTLPRRFPCDVRQLLRPRLKLFIASARQRQHVQLAEALLCFRDSLRVARNTRRPAPPMARPEYLFRASALPWPPLRIRGRHQRASVESAPAAPALARLPPRASGRGLVAGVQPAQPIPPRGRAAASSRPPLWSAPGGALVPIPASFSHLASTPKSLPR